MEPSKNYTEPGDPDILKMETALKKSACGGSIFIAKCVNDPTLVSVVVQSYVDYRAIGMMFNKTEVELIINALKEAVQEL